jgi:hypothetical protein
VLAIDELCFLFLGSFWTVIMVSTGISVIWRHNGTKYPHHAVSILPDDQNTWKIDHILRTSND